MPIYKIKYQDGTIEEKFFKNKDLRNEYIINKYVKEFKVKNGIKVTSSTYDPNTGHNSGKIRKHKNRWK
ncbi:hypothetical protein [Mycoplasma sp. P36-A1]|uniref:hypothetical protein n=1 Tax=Mycoplasma sp. P36-A1 TaxID=3252900 RepID=UPI003C304091